MLVKREVVGKQRVNLPVNELLELILNYYFKLRGSSSSPNTFRSLGLSKMYGNRTFQ